jgi:hypothetical protein
MTTRHKQPDFGASTPQIPEASWALLHTALTSNYLGNIRAEIDLLMSIQPGPLIRSGDWTELNSKVRFQLPWKLLFSGFSRLWQGEIQGSDAWADR